MICAFSWFYINLHLKRVKKILYITKIHDKIRNNILLNIQTLKFDIGDCFFRKIKLVFKYCIHIVFIQIPTYIGIYTNLYFANVHSRKYLLLCTNFTTAILNY